MKIGYRTIAAACGAAAVMLGCAQRPLEAASPPVLGTPSARGQMLYENHCTVCHTSVVHVQENHRATSDAAVESWVRRWADDQKLGWTDEEVLDVTDFLVRRFYKF